MKKNLAIISCLVLCLPLISLAHPGHGETGGYTITHYFVEPVHVIISLVVITGLVVYFRYLRSNQQPKENS